MRNQPPPTEPGLIPLRENFYIDIGTGVFSSTNSEATVRTRLSTINYSAAQAYDTYSWATDLAAEDMISVEHTVSSGAVTLTRGTGGTDSMTFNYFFIGTLDSTD